ncbi:DUF3006 domain-containing protein [Bacillota bacterium LX-D]|nr:DUF3006 domain-containing protein [Bacillota bacterium LX-D]
MFIIDRFEGDFAIISSGKENFNLPKMLLPKDSKEGDVLQIIISIDQEQTKLRRKQMEQLMVELLKE